MWQKLWQLLCKLFRCRWGGPWLLLCCALFSLATLLPDPFCCCFYLNSKEFFLWFVYFSLQSFCFFLLFCFLQFTTSAFHLLSAFAGVTEQCCSRLSVLWAVVIWEREKGLVMYDGERPDHLAAVCWLCRRMKLSVHILVWPFPCSGWKSQSVISMCFCF